MTTYLMIFQFAIAIILIFLVLIQFGKGAETGLMSSVGDTTMPGATKGNILTKITVVISILFMANSVYLARLEGQKNASSLLAGEKAPIAAPSNIDPNALPFDLNTDADAAPMTSSPDTK